jgi:alpha-1,6-mannosyltransferase
LIGAGSAPSHLPPNVRIVSYVADRSALARLIASCDVFVHAGDQETFGLAALEAMASGVPVVGAGAAGIAELVTPETGILFRPRDPIALAEAVVGIYDRDTATLGAQARRHAEQYGWPRVLADIAQRYIQLTAASTQDRGMTKALGSAGKPTEARDPQLNAR